MTIGRWLLTHSLSLFLAAMLLAAWFWRDELELDRAWAQLRQASSEMHTPSASATQTDRADKPLPPATAPSAERNASTSDQREPLTAAANPRPAAAPDDAPQALLREAREAFWSRDFDRAIERYQQLIQRYPETPDYVGELGNVYYNLNRFDRASELFLNAGRLLLKRGEIARARQLLPPLMSLDRDRGRELAQQIRQQTQSAAQSQN